MSAALQFTDAVVIEDDYIYFSGSLDSMAAYSPHTRLFWFDEQSDHRWTKHDVDWWTVSVATFAANEEADWELCALSNEGQVEFVGSHPPFVEKIPGAGVNSVGAKGWGYMSTLKQIGDHLYAAGGAGQVYKRLGPDKWVHMDDGLLQEPDVADRLLPRAIDGPYENAIYLVGSLAAMGHPPRAYFWNGQHWRQIELPPIAERITNIYVESEDRIWLCGANGTLLLGNAEEGFKSLSTHSDNQLFYSLCKFQGKIYLGSNLGLFVYDPNDHAVGIREVVTGLTPELQDANIVDSGDGVLWSIGSKDIARFDGQKWERIHHPDNPRIGA